MRLGWGWDGNEGIDVGLVCSLDLNEGIDVGWGWLEWNGMEMKELIWSWDGLGWK